MFINAYNTLILNWCNVIYFVVIEEKRICNWQIVKSFVKFGTYWKNLQYIQNIHEFILVATYSNQP